MELETQGKLTLDIDTSELTPAQLRRIKSINMLLTHVMTTDDEADFFDGSAEVMRLCASLVQESHFCTDAKYAEIPYGEQALEFAVDALCEQMGKSSIIQYDN